MTAQLVGKEIVLSNDSLKIVISPEGRLSSIVDVALSRELLAKGKTSGFVIFQDRPLNWDAWDVDAFHLETKTEVNASSMRVVEDGPLRATVEIVYHTGQSTIRAFVSLDAFSSIPKQGDLSALRFDVNVEWHERHRCVSLIRRESADAVQLPQVRASVGDLGGECDVRDAVWVRLAPDYQEHDVRPRQIRGRRPQVCRSERVWLRCGDPQ